MGKFLIGFIWDEFKIDTSDDGSITYKNKLPTKNWFKFFKEICENEGLIINEINLNIIGTMIKLKTPYSYYTDKEFPQFFLHSQNFHDFSFPNEYGNTFTNIFGSNLNL